MDLTIIEQAALIIAGLTGLSVFIVMVVNVLKFIPGLIKDGTSDIWFKSISTIAFFAVVVILILKIPVDWGQVDTYLKLFASFLGLILELFTGGKFYELIKGTPIVGKSLSG